MNKGLYVVFEGGEGCGKTVQAKLLADKLDILYPGRVVLTREPGGSEFTSLVRHLVQEAKLREGMEPIAEAYLYATSRAHDLRRIVMPAYESGKIVICARSCISGYVYQGKGRGLGINVVRNINKEAVGTLVPNYVFLFDVPPEVGLRRKSLEEHNRFEEETLDFHKRIREGYLELAKEGEYKMKVINGEQSIERVALEVWQEMRLVLCNWEMLNEINHRGVER